MTIIMFNGKTYNSVDEMPEVEKQAYLEMMDMFTDKNGNGIPDFLEGDMVKNVLKMHSIKKGSEDGMYHSIDELPPELRQKVENAFQKLSQAGILTRLSSTTPQPVAQDPSPQPMMESKPYTPPSYNPSSAIQEDKGPSPLVWVLIGVVLALCVIGAAIAIYLTAGQ